MLRHVRDRWSIENSWHWVRDTQLREVPNEVIDQLAGEVGRCLGTSGVLWGEHVRRIESLAPNPCQPCLPNDENRLFGAGVPVIAMFNAAAEVVKPGKAVMLHCSWGNADRITIRRLSVHGPWITQNGWLHDLPGYDS